MTADERLQELLDKQAIEEVVGARYGRALDWLDVDALKCCFWPDATVDYGFFAGNAHEWCEMVMPIESASFHRFHYVMNILTRVDGDVAESESNSLAGSRKKDADGATIQTFHGSRYLDALERRDHEWRLSKRVVLLEFTQRWPSPAGPGGALKGLALAEGLGPGHPLYRRL